MNGLIRLRTLRRILPHVKHSNKNDGGAEMNERHGERRIGRRDFFKTVIGGAAALGIAGAFPAVPRMVRPAQAALSGEFNSCRIVVFGSDSLRIDYAQTLRDQGAPGLSALNPPICASCNGQTGTQAAWATIWTGLPSEKIRCWSNKKFERMPEGYHIMEKVIKAYEDQGKDIFPFWVTGKGRNVAGKKRPSSLCSSNTELRFGPHKAVKKLLLMDGRGPYYGDRERNNGIGHYDRTGAYVEAVHEAARPVLQEAALHDNFIGFVQFRDPDHEGHLLIRQAIANDYEAYMDSALEVDTYIADLMSVLPGDTNIIYCSDHGFDFVSQGDARNGHGFSPHGMLATNFPAQNIPFVDQASIGRLIYKKAGGNPDYTFRKEGEDPYRMIGCNLV
jgi:hypothetical protein